MESGGRSSRGSPGQVRPQTLDLGPEQAAQHPGAVLFNYFYSGVPKDADITTRDGKIDGTFHQRRVDDIAAQDVKISGTYDPRHFHVEFGYGAFGTPFDQIVEGQLVEPAPTNQAGEN
jgi:hypothetical protein